MTSSEVAVNRRARPDEISLIHLHAQAESASLRKMGSRSLRRSAIAAIAAIALGVTAASVAFAGGSYARPASRSEHSVILAALRANDGDSAEVQGVYVSRSNSSLAVICVRTPDAGLQAFVFHHTGRAWRYLTSGSPGAAGSPADRHLERACH